MAMKLYDSGTMFLPIRSGTPCPICGKRDGRCSEFYLDHKLLFVVCKHMTSNEPMENLPGWYKHRVDGRTVRHQELTEIPDVRKYELTEEVKELRHKVYTDLIAIINKHISSGLYEEDRAELYGRGLDDDIIERLGLFSVPKSSHKVWSDSGAFQMQLATYIGRKLYKQYGNDLLKVPGFIKLKGKRGDYISFKTKMKRPEDDKLSDIRGYFIPYKNYKGQLLGMQYRLSEPILDEKGKPIRYFWLSSKEASSGSPIDVYIPNNLKRDDVLLVGEGALKMKIAAEKLGYISVAEAGVNNYSALVEEIQMLEINNGIKYKIILALDMDKYDNVQKYNGKEIYPILEAEKKTISLLKFTNHEIAIAEWITEAGKGIDDALINGAKLYYRLV
ncbi:MAG: hypothetical protein M0Q88_05890 [Bacilli bacterium]|nr:hypothetical protein [Bacilli bacterium]